MTTEDKQTIQTLIILAESFIEDVIEQGYMAPVKGGSLDEYKIAIERAKSMVEWS